MNWLRALDTPDAMVADTTHVINPDRVLSMTIGRGPFGGWVVDAHLDNGSIVTVCESDDHEQIAQWLTDNGIEIATEVAA